MKKLDITINEQLNNKTVKHILYNVFELSDRLITDLKKGEYIKVNNEVCTVRKVLKTDDKVTITIPETETNDIIPVNGKLDILFEDENIIAVNKPADMPTHPIKYHIEDTLANLICGYLGENFVFRAVNRLDKDTTGIVLIAKNRYSAELMNRQIRNKEIKKTYIAVCCGILKTNGTVEASIKKETERGIKRIISHDGQYAKTEYNVVRTQNNCSLVRLYPQTGRTHQIRVHMASIGHPLYGDYLYGTEVPGIRMQLHCECMDFIHPVTKNPICIKSHMPDDFIINKHSSL